jgi:hypothetical protein
LYNPALAIVADIPKSQAIRHAVTLQNCKQICSVATAHRELLQSPCLHLPQPQENSL